jgi:hypothetical protein
MDFGDYYWAFWFGMFLVLELPAAIWRPKWTLSHQIWKWFAIGKPWGTNWAWFRWLILAGLTLSTTAHFLLLTSAVPIIAFGVGAFWSRWYYFRYEHGTEKLGSEKANP